MTKVLHKDVVSGLLISAGLFMILNHVFSMGMDLAAGLFFAGAWFAYAYYRFAKQS